MVKTADINIWKISEVLNDKVDRDCVNVEVDQETLSDTDFSNVNSTGKETTTDKIKAVRNRIKTKIRMK